MTTGQDEATIQEPEFGFGPMAASRRIVALDLIEQVDRGKRGYEMTGGQPYNSYGDSASIDETHQFSSLVCKDPGEILR